MGKNTLDMAKEKRKIDENKFSNMQHKELKIWGLETNLRDTTTELKRSNMHLIGFQDQWGWQIHNIQRENDSKYSNTE